VAQEEEEKLNAASRLPTVPEVQIEEPPFVPVSALRQRMIRQGMLAPAVC